MGDKRGEAFLAFVRALGAHDDISSPEVCVEEDGDFALDWNAATNQTATMCFGQSGVVAFAYLLDWDKSHGSFVMDADGTIPDSILCILRAVSKPVV